MSEPTVLGVHTDAEAPVDVVQTIAYLDNQIAVRCATDGYVVLTRTVKAWPQGDKVRFEVEAQVGKVEVVEQR